jgi:NAD(P)-dependent dehydrogenase (short-subunit alcohol dehydrogenase family)
MKVVLVTGGSSGIGAAVARRSAKQGWKVFLTYRKGLDRAQEIVDELRSINADAEAIPLTLEHPSSVTHCISQISHRAGQLDAIVLSASPAPRLSSFLKEKSDELLNQFRVNVVANHQLIVEAWKTFFCSKGDGHVIALLSAFIEPPPAAHMSSYIVGKRALLTLLECASVELGTSGLKLSAILPSYTETPMLNALNRHVYEMARLKQPDAKFMQPDEVALRVLSCLENPPTAIGVHLHSVVPLKSPS